MLRRNAVSIAVCLLVAGSPTMATWGLVADDPPKEADQRFEKLLAKAMQAPDKTDWKALREAFATTSHYDPYNTEVTERLKEIARAIGRGEARESEAALLKLAERERFMRFDTLAMLMRLYRRTDQPEKAEKYRKILDGILGVLKDPKAGTGFDNAIEVLFIEEEYLVVANMPIKGQGLIPRNGHWFDVLQIGADGDEAMRQVYFNVDLPYITLLNRAEGSK